MYARMPRSPGIMLVLDPVAHCLCYPSPVSPWTAFLSHRRSLRVIWWLLSLRTDASRDHFLNSPTESIEDSVGEFSSRSNEGQMAPSLQWEAAGLETIA